MKKIFIILAIAALTLSACGQKKVVTDETVTVIEQPVVETVVDSTVSDATPSDTLTVE